MRRLLAAFFALLAVSSSVAFAGEWTGQIAKRNGRLQFVSSGVSYSITNPDKAEGFEGQAVKVTGAADRATKAITLTTVAKA